VPVLLEVQDPGNVGTILRSALAFGAPCAVVEEGSARPFHEKVIRASAGAVFRLPLVVGEEWRRLLTPHDRILLTDPHRGVVPEEAPLGRRTFVLFGNERRGLGVGVPEGTRVRVPLLGPVESLNVAAAAAVLLYVLGRRQRGEARPCQEPRPPVKSPPRIDSSQRRCTGE
jgi:TrmH family RNA methyltransferase